MPSPYREPGCRPPLVRTLWERLLELHPGGMLYLTNAELAELRKDPRFWRMCEWLSDAPTVTGPPVMRYRVLGREVRAPYW